MTIPLGGDDYFRPLCDAAPRRCGELIDHHPAHIVTSNSRSSTAPRSTYMRSMETSRSARPARRIFSFTLTNEFRIDVHDREAGSHHAGQVDRGSAKSQHGNVQHLAQFVQARIENITDQQRIVSLALRTQAVRENFRRVDALEVSVLIRDRRPSLSPKTSTTVPGAADRVKNCVRLCA